MKSIEQMSYSAIVAIACIFGAGLTTILALLIYYAGQLCSHGFPSFC